MLGVPKFRLDMREESDTVGLVMGLAFTVTGGTTLEAEATIVPGKGKLIITGVTPRLPVTRFTRHEIIRVLTGIVLPL